VSGDVRYVLRDGGRDRLEILAESSRDPLGFAVLPVTVATPDRTTDYFLVFIAEKQSGMWVAAINAPEFRDWADVSVHEMRELASLGADDAKVVARSVRAAPDLWVPVWQAEARGRGDGDPVREAIQDALRS
jgi:hypothetical protein